MYSICSETGVVTRTADGVQVAPCASCEEPNYKEYVKWIEEGNTPSETAKALDVKEIVSNSIQRAMNFGKELSLEFLTENVMLDITQLGMVEQVRESMDIVFRAIETGSLFEAIARMKKIPEELKDPIFVNDARLLRYVNKIEEYLGIDLSTSL